jgi:LPXTG-motif cell wall-anchored protein
MARGLPHSDAKEYLAMKPFSSINTRTAVCGALLAVAVASGIAVTHARADEWNKKTILTIGEPVQVKDDLLQPGTYVFKLLDSADRHVVQIFNADQSHLIDTILAIPDYRVNLSNRQFTFYETPEGSAKAMREWFYPGDNFGQEFPYPKHLVMLQASAALTAPQPALQPAAPEPAPEPQAAVQVPESASAPPVEEPVQIAQNSPPPTPAPAAQPAPQEAPATLPQTGSQYPLIGLSGLLSIGLFGLLRLKRSD